jgi:hypothetical protein
MLNRKFQLFTLVVLFTSYLFMGGDCSTDTEPEPEPTPDTVAPPGSISLIVDAIPGGNSYALINWTASSSENRSDFKGYRVRTVSLNASGQIISVFEEREVSKTPRSYQVLSINRGTRYKTFLWAELNDGKKSDSLETKVYSGVYYNNNGVIDSYTSDPSNSKSGYGWNVNTGAGSQYSYTETNSGLIDINLRLLENELFFFSPDVFNNLYKTTAFSLVGSGLQAFDETDLLEPSGSIIKVQLDNVYLIKTHEGYYIKIWIKAINPPSGNRNYFIVNFDYKVQPVEGLRLVKR